MDIKKRPFFRSILDESEIRPYEDDEQEDDNDTNITDDEENVDVVREAIAIIFQHMPIAQLNFFSFSLAQNYYYQKLGIGEKPGNSARLKLMLETTEIANDMKNLLITNPNAAEPETTPNPDVKPNAPTTSSSPTPVPSKTEQ